MTARIGAVVLGTAAAGLVGVAAPTVAAAAHCAGGWVSVGGPRAGGLVRVQGFAWAGAGTPVTMHWSGSQTTVTVPVRRAGSFALDLRLPAQPGYYTLVAAQGTDVYRAQVDVGAAAPVDAAAPSAGIPMPVPQRLPAGWALALLLAAAGVGVARRQGARLSALGA